MPGTGTGTGSGTATGKVMVMVTDAQADAMLEQLREAAQALEAALHLPCSGPIATRLRAGAEEVVERLAGCLSATGPGPLPAHASASGCLDFTSGTGGLSRRGSATGLGMGSESTTGPGSLRVVASVASGSAGVQHNVDVDLSGVVEELSTLLAQAVRAKLT
jgi:hypothetical protein